MHRRLDIDQLRHLGMALLWLVVMALLAWVTMRQCTHKVSDGYAAPSTGLCDSLLQHSVHETQRVDYLGFVSYFNAARHLPLCVTYELTASELSGEEQRTDAFAVDPSAPGCPPPDAYQGTGLHRGHLAPAADMHWSEKAMRQSFLMTNICPQHRSLNEGGWGRLEEKCREWVKRDHALVIACGPVIEAGLDTIAGTGIPIPRRFFKVVLAHWARPMRALAFVYPNGPANGPLSRYVTTIDNVEQLTGIDFFALLPDDEQRQLESNSNLPLWLH
ncbi:MAG: DNA/RNA non-specific endonuclease [Muribaculaceae bacterium]|nr:DNA/RNA non-specific endonuclease [Muribaculaceae bacterium]